MIATLQEINVSYFRSDKPFAFWEEDGEFDIPVKDGFCHRCGKNEGEQPIEEGDPSLCHDCFVKLYCA